MNISALDSINNLVSAKQTEKSPDALRQAAAQFESLLLLQLTSALNGTNDGDDEDKLFGSDGGSGLAKQMFSEQLANSMAQSGGVGLADLIVSKISGENQTKSDLPKTTKLNSAHIAIKDIREKPISLLAARNSATNVNLRSQPPPAAESAANDFEIVSTAAEDIARYGDADLPKPVMGDEKLFRYYRPRIVPDYALNPDSGAIINSVEKASPAVNRPSLAATNIVNYQMPVSGRISSEFGNRFHPIDKRIKFHAGVDIAAPLGTPIATAASGKVIFAGWSKGYGNTVVIEHPDGRETRYGHASRLFVATGDAVTAGQQIAAVGSTGRSTGAHLHFEMREDGKAVNPLDFLP